MSRIASLPFMKHDRSLGPLAGNVVVLAFPVGIYRSPPENEVNVIIVLRNRLEAAP